MLREDAQRLSEEKTTLEGMIQSRAELIVEMAEEYGLNRMGENDNDEDEHDDDEGNVVAPPAPAPTVVLSYPVPRNRERSLHTCAQDVQITRMATI
jgi:hypothetical protein